MSTYSVYFVLFYLFCPYKYYFPTFYPALVTEILKLLFCAEFYAELGSEDCLSFLNSVILEWMLLG
jgi:hypothetical protein